MSWHAGTEAADTPAPNAPPPGKVVRASADASLVNAARDFLDRWLIRKDYEQAFRYFSTKSYACYDLIRSPGEPATSPADAGQQIRVALTRAGERVGGGHTLKQILAPMESSHPAVRLIDHPYSDTFTLTQLPNAATEAADCAALTRGGRFPKQVPLEYGNGFGMNFRFRMLSGEPPVLRMLWGRENDAWRITAFDVETP